MQNNQTRHNRLIGEEKADHSRENNTTPYTYVDPTFMNVHVGGDLNHTNNLSGYLEDQSLLINNNHMNNNGHINNEYLKDKFFLNQFIKKMSIYLMKYYVFTIIGTLYNYYSSSYLHRTRRILFRTTCILVHH